MHLRPFLLLTACLLGACEKRDAAPGSTPPDIAATKSSLRDEDSETRSANRHERPVDSDALEVVGLLVVGMNRGDQNSLDLTELLYNAQLAIKDATPSQFDAIWKKLGELKDKDTQDELRILAIYHLSARKDLIAAGRIVREKLFPQTPEDERGLLLGELFSISTPTFTEAIDFLRGIGSEEDRYFLRLRFPDVPLDPGTLGVFRDQKYRLTPDETSILMAGLTWDLADSSFNADSEESMSKVSGILETVTALETEGVFAKGARDTYLREIGMTSPQAFLKLIPPDQWVEQLRKEGYDQLIERIVTGGPFDPPSDYPHIFFTPDGTRNLPPGKTAVALNAWHSMKPDDAASWFAANGAKLPLSQQELIRAGIAQNELQGEISRSKAKKLPRIIPGLTE